MLGAKLHGLLCIAGVLNSEPHEIKVGVSIFSGLENTNDIQSYLSICNDIQSYTEYFHYLGALLECFVLLGVFNSGSNETKMVVGVFLRFQITYLQHDYLLSVKSETPMSLL